MHDHVDDAGAAGAAAQVHARAPDFVLQQLVQLPAQLLHQLSNLRKHQTHTYEAKPVRLIYTPYWIHFLLIPVNQKTTLETKNFRLPLNHGLSKNCD